jgi:hypothetical protein
MIPSGRPSLCEILHVLHDFTPEVAPSVDRRSARRSAGLAARLVWIVWKSAPTISGRIIGRRSAGLDRLEIRTNDLGPDHQLRAPAPGSQQAPNRGGDRGRFRFAAPRGAAFGLAIDEEAEALLERERSNSGLLSLLLERFGHADEAEGDEPVVCRM